MNYGKTVDCISGRYNIEFKMTALEVHFCAVSDKLVA